MACLRERLLAPTLAGFRKNLIHLAEPFLGIALQMAEASWKIGDGVLVAAAQAVQFVPGDGRGDRSIGSGPGRLGRSGGSAASVAEIVDEDRSRAGALGHRFGVPTGIGLRESGRNAGGEFLGLIP